MSKKKFFSESQSESSSKIRTLSFKLKTAISDAVNGSYNYATKENRPGTGRPWVQTQPFKINGIEGWAAVDGFDSFNSTFVDLSAREIVSAVLNGYGIFATAMPLMKDECFPAFVTHHITDKLSLERLTGDLANMFDLAIVLTMKKESIQPEILPSCRLAFKLQTALENDLDCLAHRLGTENDLQKASHYGVKMDDSNTQILGKFTKIEMSEFSDIIVKSVREFLLFSFDSGMKWGETIEDDINQEVIVTDEKESVLAE